MGNYDEDYIEAMVEENSRINYLAIYMSVYSLVLKDAEIFSLKYPDNNVGYNSIIDIAEDIRNIMLNFCNDESNIKPLPERK
jgi:hypothetical protein